jgi:hypothetical protein
MSKSEIDRLMIGADEGAKPRGLVALDRNVAV